MASGISGEDNMIDLYTAATPNGRKISIMLEEIAVPYRVRELDLSALEQKQSWFLEINPNGRIPAITDDESGVAVFESGTILIYLAEKYGKLIPADRARRYECLQWLMFQMSGLGPMQGQLHVFLKYATEKIPYAINRYMEETKRLYGVLDSRLSGVEYLGEEYSIADIATWPWIDAHEWADLSLDDFPSLRGWHERVGKRPAVVRGKNVPSEPRNGETEESKIKRISKIVL